MLLKVLTVFLLINEYSLNDKSELLDEKLKVDIKTWTTHMQEKDLARKIELETNHVEVKKLGGNATNSGSKEKITLKTGETARITMDYDRISFAFSKKIKDMNLGLVLKFNNLRDLNLQETSTSDLGVEAIAKAAKLETLNLSKTAITDESIIKLAQIKSLKSLDLEKTKITDSAATGFLKFENLEILCLNQTQVGDNVVKNLVKIPSLKSLDLSRTKISDSSLDILSQMENLKFLGIEGSGLSKIAREKLKIRLPKCNVR